MDGLVDKLNESDKVANQSQDLKSVFFFSLCCVELVSFDKSIMHTQTRRHAYTCNSMPMFSQLAAYEQH